MGYDMYIVNEDAEEKKLVAELTAKFHQACKARDELPEAQGEKPGFSEEEFEAIRRGDRDPMEPPAATPAAVLEAQKHVDLAYEAMRAAENSYFRLNIWGMSNVRAIMKDLSAARDDYNANVAWPELGPWMREGQTEPVDMDHWFHEWRSEPQWRDDDYQEPPAEVVSAFEAHAAAIKAKLCWAPPPEFPEDARIPLHKFGSNDGWLVTEEECAYAAKVLKKARDEDGANYVATLARHGWEDDNARRYFDRWIDFLEAASKRGGFTVH